MSSNALLDNISIVLVRTKTPGNIGAVARSMMNTGLSRLLLVRPSEDTLIDELKRAAGADDIIRNAKTFRSLDEAVADHHLVIGTSRRITRQRKNVGSPRESAEKIVSLLARNKVAIVFGREVNGLSREDIARCHELIAIPSSDAFPSLNLSHAVMIVAYELFLAAVAPPPSPARVLASSGELERFYAHLEDTLRHIGFLRREHADHMMFSLRQLFGRARLNQRDVQILRGILTEIGRATGAATD